MRYRRAGVSEEAADVASELQVEQARGHSETGDARDAQAQDVGPRRPKRAWAMAGVLLLLLTAAAVAFWKRIVLSRFVAWLRSQSTARRLGLIGSISLPGIVLGLVIIRDSNTAAALVGAALLGVSVGLIPLFLLGLATAASVREGDGLDVNPDGEEDHRIWQLVSVVLAVGALQLFAVGVASGEAERAVPTPKLGYPHTESRAAHFLK
jgi:hypothetical protein